MHPALPRHVASALALFGLLLPACSGSMSAPTTQHVRAVSSDRPALRSAGERLPPVSGMNPAASEWAEVEAGVWISGLHLRTAHVSIRSDASEQDGRRVADPDALEEFGVHGPKVPAPLGGPPS